MLILSTADRYWRDVLSFSLLPYERMTSFRYFAVGENAQFACNSAENLVNREASLYFLKLVLFRSYLASAWVKKSFVLSTIEKYHNIRSATYGPSELKFCKADKENFT